jgi:hypothetical protein
MHTLIGRIITSSLIGLSLLAGASASAGEPADTGDVIAVWKSQRVAFDYRSDGRYYSCGALEHKIKLILEELGADARLELRRSSCRDLASLTRFELVMRSPVEATEANVREITDYGSEAQLVARVRGIELPSAGELATFPAAWSSVSFRRLDLDARDCALVQQLRNQVLPKMSVRITKDIRGLDCAQEHSGMGPQLTVIALVPSPVDRH